MWNPKTTKKRTQNERIQTKKIKSYTFKSNYVQSNAFETSRIAVSTMFAYLNTLHLHCKRYTTFTNGNKFLLLNSLSRK